MESTKRVHIDRNHLILRTVIKISGYAAVLIAAFYIGTKSFLVFHTAVEIACSIIAFTMAVIAINTHKMRSDNRIIFLGMAYGFVGVFDVIHTFAYKGMGFLVSNSGNLPTQLWIIARYMESISLLIISMFPNKRFKLRRAFPIYLAFSVVLLLSIFVWDNFPSCYLEESGLTSFKIISEYIISGILLMGIFCIVKKNQYSSKKTIVLLTLSLLTTLVSEICFTLYSSVYDIANILGHIFKLISFYFVYISLVETSLQEPYYALNEMNKTLNIRNQDLKHLIEQLKLECEMREKIETESTRKNQILNAILETSLSGILVIGRDRRIIHINKTFLDMWDMPYDVLLSKDWIKIINLMKGQLSNLDEVKAYIEKAWEIRDNYPFFLHVTDGRIIEVIASPFVDRDIVSGKILMLRDITEKKVIDELQKKVEIRQALLEKAKEYDELKTNFFSTVSHEFKTPLNIILGVIQMLEKICSKDIRGCNNSTSIKYIKMMKQNCNRLLKLVNNIVDITRIDSGFMQINLKNENIISIIEDITLSVAEYTNNKGILLIFDTDMEEKTVACDGDMLERIMLNLLSNAIKFTENEGRIMVNVSENKDSVIISVKDTGTGIPKDMLDKIFDRFRQVDSSLRKKSEGSGIGLSLVKSLVELHGGSISLESEWGKGSEFIVELPARQIDDINETNELPAAREVNVEKINIEFSDIYM